MKTFSVNTRHCYFQISFVRNAAGLVKEEKYSSKISLCGYGPTVSAVRVGGDVPSIVNTIGYLETVNCSYGAKNIVIDINIQRPTENEHEEKNKCRK